MIDVVLEELRKGGTLRCDFSAGAQGVFGRGWTFERNLLTVLPEGVIRAMYGSKLKSIAASLFFAVVLGMSFAGGMALAEPPRKSQLSVIAAHRTAADISEAQFDEVRALIKPKPGGFDDIAWMTDLWEARKKAAAEGKPLLVWVGDGHPLGWT